MYQIKFIHTVIYNQLQSKNRHYYIYTIENQPWKCISVVAATERLEAANGAQKYGTERTLISQSSPELPHI